MGKLEKYYIYIWRKEPSGMGYAILCAKQFIGNEPFDVLLGDDMIYNEEKPALRQFIDLYERIKTFLHLKKTC